MISALFTVALGTRETRRPEPSEAFFPSGVSVNPSPKVHTSTTLQFICFTFYHLSFVSYFNNSVVLNNQKVYSGPVHFSTKLVSFCTSKMFNYGAWRNASTSALLFRIYVAPDTVLSESPGARGKVQGPWYSAYSLHTLPG